MIEFNNWKEIQSVQGNGTSWQILAFPQIKNLQAGDRFDSSRIIAAGQDLEEAMIKAISPAGFVSVYPVFPKHSVRIVLNNSSVLCEPGAMHFTKGNMEMTLDTPKGSGGIGGFFKSAVTSLASGESLVKPRFTGTGEVFLEPTRKFLFLIAIENTTFICDQGLWMGCDGAMEVDGHINSFSAALNSGEGMVMPRVRGTGVVLIESPIPFEKILVINLENETLSVDGAFVMAFWGDLTFTTEKAAKGLLASAASGEGLVNTYKGTGTLWLDMEEAGCFATDI